ncbi:methylated-DNA--[protein]-cysteine S-methyltransferase, partial [Salmonella enterica subsp. enterica serovar Worthington]|nr:methylated-DNA--[protein]-cysteine S-methyltransferase [Salmonella enterica subsp. enterica serovar Worthington]
PAARHEPADAPFQQRVRQVVAAINTRDLLLSLPLDIQGTAFQQQVWQALCAIPCSETVSYQQLAATIGKPAAVRAVASACGANKLAMVIPCHRRASRWRALGYRWGVRRKAQLLKREAQKRSSNAGSIC